MTATPQEPRPRVLVASDCTLCTAAVETIRAVAATDYRFPLCRDDAKAILGEYDAVLCDAYIKFDRELLKRATRLRVIATPSTGTDHLDKAYLLERGIDCLDLAHEYELLETFTATAEGAWLLLLACVRRLPRNFERAKQGQIGLEDRGTLPRQLRGRTLGIIGLGRLGRMVARYGIAFGMRVIANDVQPVAHDGVERVDLDTLIAEADVVSLHLHLTEQTRHVIDRRRLAGMKPGVVLINTARGDLIDEDALVDALESGRVAAAGVDVVHDEWDPRLAKHRLHRYAATHDNLIITPHVASACYESVVGARLFMARELVERLRLMNLSGDHNA